MDSVDIEVLRSAEAWRKAGHRVTLGTIVKTWGSAPRPVGAMVAIRDDGQVAGSVSGGCVEDDLIDKVKSGTAAPDKPQVIAVGVHEWDGTRGGPAVRGDAAGRPRAGDRGELDRIAARIDRQAATRAAQA